MTLDRAAMAAGVSKVRNLEAILVRQWPIRSGDKFSNRSMIGAVSRSDAHPGFTEWSAVI